MTKMQTKEQLFSTNFLFEIVVVVHIHFDYSMFTMVLKVFFDIRNRQAIPFRNTQNT